MNWFAGLVCPVSKAALVEMDAVDAEMLIGSPLVPLRLNQHYKGKAQPSVGRTSRVLLREDRCVAYPVVDDIPILLWPEALGSEERTAEVDLDDVKYAEAYEEMAFYNDVAEIEAKRFADSDPFAIVNAVVGAIDEFPRPRSAWLDATYELAAQWDAYCHIGPLDHRTVAQFGGKGIHAVKFLVGGAAETWLVTPMLGEAKFARALADQFGVGDGLRPVVAVAEENPLPEASLDAIYTYGCLHHMDVASVVPDIIRVLRPEGKFAALDPYRAPLYRIGTGILGKREAGIECRPLTYERLEPLFGQLRHPRVVHHGALTRYPLLALQKIGLQPSRDTIWWLTTVDDRISRRWKRLERWGSSIAVLAEAP